MWDELSEAERIVATGMTRIARAAVGQAAVDEMDDHYFAILAANPGASNYDIAARSFSRWRERRDRKKAAGRPRAG